MRFCSLYSGSSGNSIFVGSDNTRLLIDAGLSGKAIEGALKSIDEDPSKIDGILVTHEHSDHIKGLGILSRRYNIPIYANEGTLEAMKTSLGKVKEDNIKCIDDYVRIKDIDITPYRISHDAASPMGYALNCEGKKVCIATDLGYFSEEVEKNLQDADIILLESNHDVEMLKLGPYPYYLKRRILSDVGHLSNDACGNAILKLLNKGPKKIILGHLSKTNNYPELAYKTVLNILESNGVKDGQDVCIYMAKRDMPSSYINF